ncbi:hypothetical protein ACIQ2D_00275 [Lysinibacillus sp. NPDC097287]|uniref:hypothetical protein n=1 Tax=Lysinibacillus sp. NPDC097287 TaxID=3364144 RepID=UPI00380C707F
MLHEIEYNGEVIKSTTDTYGSGSINTATCRSIDVKEAKKELITHLQVVTKPI